MSRQALVQQRVAVERAAAEVARARSDGARRSEVKRLMALYRVEAEALADLESRAARTPDQEAATHRQAQAQLAEAVAAGAEDAAGREVLSQWLGPLPPRIALLKEALAAAEGLPDADLTRDILLDTVEQSQAVMLAAAYDAEVAGGQAQWAQARAEALRRAAPGQAGGLDAEVEAQRLEQEAGGHKEAQAAARAIYTEASQIRSAALKRLE